MSFKISTFRKALDNAGARQSLFEVSLFTGARVATLISDAGNESGDYLGADGLKFTCRATTIPGLTVTSIPVSYFGRELKVPGEMEFADWSVTVMNDNGSRVRRSVEKWMAHINAHSANMMDNNFLEQTTAGTYPWTGVARITQYSKSGIPTHKYEMKNCWPTSIDPIDVSYDSVGTIQEYGITWALDYWTYHSEGDGLSGTAPTVALQLDPSTAPTDLPPPPTPAT